MRAQAVEEKRMSAYGKIMSAYSYLGMGLSHPVRMFYGRKQLASMTPRGREQERVPLTSFVALQLAQDRNFVTKKNDSLVERLGFLYCDYTKAEFIPEHYVTRIVIATAKRSPRHIAAWLKSDKIPADAKLVIIDCLPPDRYCAVRALLPKDFFSSLTPLDEINMGDLLYNLLMSNKIARDDKIAFFIAASPKAIAACINNVPNSAERFIHTFEARMSEITPFVLSDRIVHILFNESISADIKQKLLNSLTDKQLAPVIRSFPWIKDKNTTIECLELIIKMQPVRIAKAFELLLNDYPDDALAYIALFCSYFVVRQPDELKQVLGLLMQANSGIIDKILNFNGNVKKGAYATDLAADRFAYYALDKDGISDVDARDIRALLEDPSS